MNEYLRQSIQKTLAYFDIYDYPLTGQEVHRFLWQQEASLVQVLRALTEMKDAGEVHTSRGFYYLPGRSSTVSLRLGATVIEERKMKIAKRAVKKLRWIPFVEAVFVCNTLAAHIAKKNSDIDFFIITKENRIWITRLLVILSMIMFRFRITGKKRADKVCLSFYSTDAHLNLSDIALSKDEQGLPDIYLLYWLGQLAPVYDPKGILETIQRENNWVSRYIPQLFGEHTMWKRWSVVNTKVQVHMKWFFEMMWQGNYGSLLNGHAEQIQTPKLEANFYGIKDEDDSRVVISDSLLKFHSNDRRAFFRDMWKRRVQNIV